MCIVQRQDRDHPVDFGCVQAGCRDCVERLALAAWREDQPTKWKKLSHLDSAFFAAHTAKSAARRVGRV